jgi:biotin-(acetyl-CoA carboxylase) ligase
VVGIGLNLNQIFPPEDRVTFPPVSVNQLRGNPVDREAALFRLLVLLEEAAIAFRSGRFASILETYQTHLFGRNFRVAFDGPEGVLQAQLMSVNENGEALVLLNGSEEQRFTHPTYRLLGIPEGGN